MKTWNLKLILILILAASASFLQFFILEESFYNQLNGFVAEGESFRAHKVEERLVQELDTLASDLNMTKGEVVAAAMVQEKGYYKEKMKQMGTGFWEHNKGREYQSLEQSCKAVWDDLEVFPVLDPMDGEKTSSFENSWMFERTFGGVRGHEGCDLMPEKDIRDYYRIVSVCDGIVEKIGWLPKGGYRVGIRGESGAYYYYAHLSEYAIGLEEGSEINAGELIGLMGDTGYGPEGTTGKFKVHLHFGIYIRTEKFQELSINPYWPLRYLWEKNISNKKN